MSTGPKVISLKPPDKTGLPILTSDVGDLMKDSLHSLQPTTRPRPLDLRPPTLINFQPLKILTVHIYALRWLQDWRLNDVKEIERCKNAILISSAED